MQLQHPIAPKEEKVPLVSAIPKDYYQALYKYFEYQPSVNGYYPRGIPNPRCAMILRCTSEVPAAIVALTLDK